jgi:hypothetical protein
MKSGVKTIGQGAAVVLPCNRSDFLVAKELRRIIEVGRNIAVDPLWILAFLDLEGPFVA